MKNTNGKGEAWQFKHMWNKMAEMSSDSKRNYSKYKWV